MVHSLSTGKLTYPVFQSTLFMDAPKIAHALLNKLDGSKIVTSDKRCGVNERGN